jgi:hypothetical protein
LKNHLFHSFRLELSTKGKMQQQISGGAPPPSSFQVISMLVTWIISVVALGVATYSLYLQRKDRKPRLNISVETTTDELGPHTPDGYGGTIRTQIAVIVIHASNPTDKPINVESIRFKPTGYPSMVVPLSQTISSIPPHDKRQAIVVVPQLRAELGVANSGQFVVIDALGNEHKTRPMVV